MMLWGARQSSGSGAGCPRDLVHQPHDVAVRDDDIAAIEDAPGDAVRLAPWSSVHTRARDVVPVHLGAGARRDGLAVERIADEREPFAPLDGLHHPVDAGRSQRGDRPALGKLPHERLELCFGGAVVRVGRRARVVADRPSTVAPNTARLESTTARPTPAARAVVEQRDAAVDIRCQKRCGIVAFAAAIAAGHMVERRMHEHVRAVDERLGRRLGAEVAVDPLDFCRQGRAGRMTAAARRAPPRPPRSAA